MQEDIDELFEDGYQIEQKRIEMHETIKATAWQVLYDSEEPMDRGDWVDAIIAAIPEVITDYYQDPIKAYTMLEDMWECDDYQPEHCEYCYDFRGWSEFFANNTRELFEDYRYLYEKVYG